MLMQHFAAETDRFAGKVAIVTGGASGIGAATARRITAEGGSVVVADIQIGPGEEVARSLAGRGLFHRCDVSSLADWLALVEATLGRFGRLDIVHNNAYIVKLQPTHELSEEDWDRQVSVCLKQVFLSVKTCMPHLMKSSGVMVNTSSVHAVMAFPLHSAYDASKGGVSSLTRELAAEYAPHVRVNAVLPGGIDTAAWAGRPQSEFDAFSRATPAGRLGTAEEVAAAVCFLASDDASYITGANLVVDGGYTITKGEE
jgi:NAD(P)-dependent dehydrogenase (short-subunit alcohol dehydrogenase family)